MLGVLVRPGSSRATAASGRARAPPKPTSCATGRRRSCSSARRPGVPLGPDEGHGRRPRGVRRHVHASQAHLVLAGPAVTGVSDDPEGEAVWAETVSAWKGLPASVGLASISPASRWTIRSRTRRRQRRSAARRNRRPEDLAEGFGLTVAEAMLKTRPVVASAVGGIVDQVIPGETGSSSATRTTLAPRRRRRLAPPRSGGGAAPGHNGDATSSNDSSATATCFSRRAAHRNRQHFGEQEDDDCTPDTKPR